jgi:cell division septation protein DedD
MSFSIVCGSVHRIFTASHVSAGCYNYWQAVLEGFAMRKLGRWSVAAAKLVAAVSLTAMLLAGCSRERADWRSAQAADTSEAYQEFLRQHPSSNDAVQAQARIKQLAEDRDWQSASTTDTRDAYQQFLAQHADSKWAQEARIRIENFAQGGNTGSAAAAASAAPSPSAAPPPSAAPSSPAAPPPAGSEPTKPPVGRVTGEKATSPLAAASAAKSSRHKAAAAAGGGSHYVQLGAFRSKTRAQAQWKRLAARFPAQLKSLTPRYVAGKSKGKSIYRLQVGVASGARAAELCTALKKRSQPCVPVAA